MRKLIVLLIVLSVISCAKELTKEEKMQKSITTEFLKTMNDPSTFEFVSMGIKKTFKVSERKKVMNEEHLKDLKKYQGEVVWDVMIKQIEIEMEFLKSKNEEEDGVYYVDFVARGSNSFGAIMKNDYSAVVLNDENLTVVNLKQMNN